MVTSKFLKIPTLTSTPLVTVPVEAFFLVYCLVLSRAVLNYCIVGSGFDRFHRKKTEAPTELPIYMFTDLVLDYIQYLHVVTRLHVDNILCL